MEHRAAILTIGYGKRSTAEVLALLQQHACQFLVDVRSRPYSRFKPEFNRESLKTACEKAGIKTIFMGDSLGGMPDSKDCYDDDGRVNYAKLAATPAFLRGIQRLQDAVDKGYRTALFCCEMKPEECHRSKLVGVALAQKGINILHIDEHGHLIPQSAVMNRMTGGQMDLFGENETRLR